MRPPKLYVVTRQDLTFGQQAVQGMHAMTEFTMANPEATRHWYESSNHLAFLSVRGEGELHDLLRSALRNGYLATPFFEPDLDDEMTAVALEPAAKNLLRDLPLALQVNRPEYG